MSPLAHLDHVICLECLNWKTFEARVYGTPSVTKINSAIGRHKVRENVMHARRAVIVTRRAVTLQDVL